jgi:small-conductance mechanosensitive channel
MLMTDWYEQFVATAGGVLNATPLLNADIAGSALWRWILALAAATALYFVARLVLSQAIQRLGRLSERTDVIVDDMLVTVLAATSRLAVGVAAVLAASFLLEAGNTLATLRRWAGVIAVTMQAGLWAQRAVTFWLEHQRDRLAETDPGAMTTLQGMSYLARTIIWSAAVILMLDNLGYNVSALLAGLGIGGVAVALALQNVLGDLFASLSIALDKPFVTGDFIIVDDKLGTVSHVGLKTTRVTSLSGEQLVFSNSDLLSSRIRNYKRMQERRVAFSFGVLYQTPVEQLEEIPTIVRRIVEATPESRFDRAHFKEFGDSAYTFEVVYYVLAPEYELYMDCQQNINLELCRAFEEIGIEFAYPTRTLHIAPKTGPALALVERTG